jgi:DNA-binding CsgD family transcriptional regulator
MILTASPLFLPRGHLRMKNAETSERHLTAREFECLTALADGLSNEGIATRLHISIPTVAMHLTNARHKLNAATREHAVAIAMRSGLLK